MLALTCLTAVGLGVALRPAAADFTDVPSDYWAKSWIDYLTSAEISQGYPDGTFKPDLPVTRDQMAVFLGRVLEAMKPVRGVAWVMPDEATAGAYHVIAPVQREASAYELYSGMNGVDFSLLSSATYQVGLDFVRWYVPTAAANTYFKPVAVVDGEERQLCHLLTAGPGSGPVPITITSPSGNPVPRMPIIEWTSVPNAVAYYVVVNSATPDLAKDYWAITEAWRTGLRSHQRQGPGVLFGNVLTPDAPAPLAGDADFTVKVYGIDAGGYGFASGSLAFHTMP
jgi:hypothetical protein